MRIATGPDLVRQQHSIQPAVNDTVTWPERYAPAVMNEIRQRVLGFNIDRLRLRGGVTETLHDKIGREAKTGELFQLIARHRTRGVLRSNGPHAGFTIGPWANTVTLTQSTGTAYNFLCKRKSCI